MYFGKVGVEVICLLLVSPSTFLILPPSLSPLSLCLPPAYPPFLPLRTLYSLTLSYSLLPPTLRALPCSRFLQHGRLRTVNPPWTQHPGFQGLAEAAAAAATATAAAAELLLARRIQGRRS